jgi:DNA polymerase III beta subunit, central domain
MTKTAKKAIAVEDKGIVLSPADFKNRLEKLRPFISKDYTRYYLNSVYMEYAKGTLILVATNGHILCEMTIHVAGKEEPFAAICPERAVETLIAMLDEEDAVITLRMEDGKLIFKARGFHLFVDPIDHEYPNYRKVIPEDKPIAKQGFAAHYLLSILEALDKEPVDICIGDSQQRMQGEPHLFVSNKVEGIRCVAMPKLITNP